MQPKDKIDLILAIFGQNVTLNFDSAALSFFFFSFCFVVVFVICLGHLSLSFPFVGGVGKKNRGVISR